MVLLPPPVNLQAFSHECFLFSATFISSLRGRFCKTKKTPHLMTHPVQKWYVRMRRKELIINWLHQCQQSVTVPTDKSRCLLCKTCLMARIQLLNKLRSFKIWTIWSETDVPVILDGLLDGPYLIDLVSCYTMGQICITLQTLQLQLTDQNLVTCSAATIKGVLTRPWHTQNRTGSAQVDATMSHFQAFFSVTQNKMFLWTK